MFIFQVWHIRNTLPLGSRNLKTNTRELLSTCLKEIIGNASRKETGQDVPLFFNHLTFVFWNFKEYIIYLLTETRLIIVEVRFALSYLPKIFLLVDLALNFLNPVSSNNTTWFKKFLTVFWKALWMDVFVLDRKINL